MKLFRALVASLGLMILITPVTNAEMAIPPAPERYVTDQTGTLSSEQISSLGNMIDEYKQKTRVQLGVLMVSKLTDDYIERFSLNVARGWGIGEKGKNNGALLLIVKDEHKMRIEVGTGLEGDLTDARSGRIIRERIAPAFQKGDYYDGIKSGVEGMILAINAKPDTTAKPSGFSLAGLFVQALPFLIMIIIWIGSILGRSKRWWPGGVVGGVVGGGASAITGAALPTILVAVAGAGIAGLLLDFFVSRNYNRARGSGDDPAWWAGGSWFGGGFGGGSSGDSGSGFGGGDFGGGGASGDW